MQQSKLHCKPFYNLLSCREEYFLIKHIRIIVANNPPRIARFIADLFKSRYILVGLELCCCGVCLFFVFLYFAVFFGQLKANTHLSYVNRMNLFAAVPSSGFFLLLFIIEFTTCTCNGS